VEEAALCSTNLTTSQLPVKQCGDCAPRVHNRDGKKGNPIDSDCSVTGRLSGTGGSFAGTRLFRLPWDHRRSSAIALVSGRWLIDGGIGGRITQRYRPRVAAGSKVWVDWIAAFEPNRRIVPGGSLLPSLLMTKIKSGRESYPIFPTDWSHCPCRPFLALPQGAKREALLRATGSGTPKSALATKREKTRPAPKPRIAPRSVGSSRRSEWPTLPSDNRKKPVVGNQ